jgi:hypothetical protein
MRPRFQNSISYNGEPDHVCQPYVDRAEKNEAIQLRTKDAPVANTELKILRFFATGFFGQEIASLDNLFHAIDEWWFVPRSEVHLLESNHRANEAIRKYQASQMLPEHFYRAYDYAHSPRRLELEELQQSFGLISRPPL